MRARDVGITEAHDEVALVAAHAPADEKCGVRLDYLHAYGLQAAGLERGRHRDVDDFAEQRLDRLVDTGAVIVRLVLESEHAASYWLFVS